MKIYHPKLANGRWKKLAFAEQMAHIGSEVIRALNWQSKNSKISLLAMERAMELIDLTLASESSASRLKELCRTRETLVDYYYGKNLYSSTKDAFDRYFYQFTYLAQLKREN
ncbi:MAG: hypothetical protein HYT11_04630 [Candidatus Levybacteria bacterium]|nr:hypothetical protein [Candidatus Levybacteria bacterium]